MIKPWLRMEEELQTDAASTNRVGFQTSLLPRQDRTRENDPEDRESEGSEGDNKMRHRTLEN